MKPGKLQSSKRGAMIIVGMSTTVHNLLFCAFIDTMHELCNRDVSIG